jgi:hypothetical protein
MLSRDVLRAAGEHTKIKSILSACRAQHDLTKDSSVQRIMNYYKDPNTFEFFEGK